MKVNEILGSLHHQCCSPHPEPTFEANLKDTGVILSAAQLVGMRSILDREYSRLEGEINQHKRKVSTSAGYVPRQDYLAKKKESRRLKVRNDSMSHCYEMIQSRLDDLKFVEPTTEQIVAESIRMIGEMAGSVKVEREQIKFFGDEELPRNPGQFGADQTISIDFFANILNEVISGAYETSLDKQAKKSRPKRRR